MLIRNTFNAKNYWLDRQSHPKLSPLVEEMPLGSVKVNVQRNRANVMIESQC